MLALCSKTNCRLCLKNHEFKEILITKHAYSHIMTILPPKNENFQVKNSYIFHISAPNIECGYSLEPPQSMFIE